MDIKKYKKEQAKRSPMEKLSDAIGASREEKRIKRTTSDGFMVKRKKEVEIPKKEAVKEHEHLTKVLDKGNKKELKKESKKQKGELKEYKQI